MSEIAIEIQIAALDEASQIYPTSAELPDNRFFAGELRLDMAKLAGLETQPQDYGLELFYALFTGKIREAYDRAVALAQENAAELRVRLWISERAPEVAALPWERLHVLSAGTPHPLAAAADRPFSRWVRYTEGDLPPLTERPLRLLFFIANPTDLAANNLAEIDVAAEVRTLLASATAQQVQITLAPGRSGLPDDLISAAQQAGYRIITGPGSLAALQTLLAADAGFHIVHFLGHGRVSRRARNAALMFEDATGAMEAVRDEQLVALVAGLSAAQRPRLLYLSACQSAARIVEQQNPFVGLAPRLVEAGLPAVVAMQDVVSQNAARELHRVFYTALLDHGVVDRALNQARQALFTQSLPDWPTPVLFMRLQDGRLFGGNPLRSALVAIEAAPSFNPLPRASDYLPLEVLHLASNLETVNLEHLVTEQPPCRDMLDTLHDLFASAPPGGQARFVALVGESGAGKSVQLQRTVKVTAQDGLAALNTGAGRVVLPVYINLEKLAQSGPPAGSSEANPVYTLILESLRPFWPPEGAPLAQVIAGKAGATLRIIADGSESLPDHLRHRAWQALNEIVAAHPQHEYMVTSTAAGFDAHTLHLTDALVIRPIAPRTLKRYLLSQGARGAQFYARMEELNLLDLASAPWLLFEMWKQVRRGIPPHSQVQVLRQIVEDAIADIAADQGMRAHAQQSLYTLAWQMHSTRRPMAPIDEAFQILAEVRGRRGYDLEAFFLELVKRGLLAQVGDECVRFARPHIQAYCVAQALARHPNRDAQIEDIVATLGRRSRYEWWQYPLTLLCGLLPSPEPLLRQLLYDVALSEGEQVFLAVRCFQEYRNNAGAGRQTLPPALVNYVLSALLWRLNGQHEPDTARRMQVIKVLGDLRYAGAISQLVEIACKPLRETPQGKVYEPSQVRLEAVLALRRIIPPPYAELQPHAPQLVAVLTHWAVQDSAALEGYLRDDALDPGIQAIAAFALGDIQTPSAISLLIQTFFAPNLSSETYRNVTTALSRLDPGQVTRCVILPLVAPDAPYTCEFAPRPTPEAIQQHARWHENLAYLIGRNRTQSVAAREFLYWCLYEYPDVQLKILAIQSLGMLYDQACKEWLEDIALGKLEALDLPECTAQERELLQLRALEALYYIGDEQTLLRLQARPETWALELERAFYRASEEILSRRHELN